MSGPSSRRGFLRGLTTLPLIGGGVTLIGAPSAVAELVTVELLSEYETWLGIEQYRVARELRGPNITHVGTRYYGAAHDWHMERCDAELPSTRAALVLSAVGCEWRR